MWTGVADDKFRVADDDSLAGGAAVGPRRVPRSPPERSLEGARVLVAEQERHLGLGKLHRRTRDREKAAEHLTTATVLYGGWA